MNLLIVSGALALLIILITACKVNAFLAFLFVSILAGLLLGVPVENITGSVEKGMSDILGGNIIIIIVGAMLGKLVAETGAAQKLATAIMKPIGVENIHWALALVGLIVGIPLFYSTAFVLLVPLIFSMVYQYKIPSVPSGISLLAGLSVTHGYLPPHPSPSALVTQFNASIGVTMFYGMLIAVPTIILAGPLFSRTLKGVVATPLPAFQAPELAAPDLPTTFQSFFAALLPVGLFALTALFPFILPEHFMPAINFLSRPSIVMLVSLFIITFTLGLKKQRSIADVMMTYSNAVKEIAMILLIIAGAGALKQVLIDSGISSQIAALLQKTSLSPLFLGWLTAAIIRIAVGSATVAGFTAAGIIVPLLQQTQVDPNLMVLSIGAGSLMLSHVNDTGFWLFKEYFNVSMKDTFRSWSLMETIVSISGLIGVLVLECIVS